MLRSDYAGAFDPDWKLSDLSRQALATLGREYLLLGHLIDRVGLPLVMQRFGGDAYVQFSIEEWMAASPVYSKRVQRAFGFEGDDVATVFKNLQLDIGAPHQFMDFQFRLDGPGYGEFWLPHCGALLDVEPYGEKKVVQMCHAIEDPTFDATAAATNPRMKMRPIHRPPRAPAGRYPHCRWKVYLDEEGEPFEPHANLAATSESHIARVEIEDPGGDAEPGGWADYSGPFDPGFQLEDLSHRALVVAAQEFAVQGHLLVRAYLLCVSQRFGEADAAELRERQWVGAAALAAHRIRKALAIEGDDAEAIAKLFQVHPHFHPRSYVDLRVEVTGPRSLRLGFGEGPAFEEGDAHSWLASLAGEPPPALEAIACAIQPRARCRPAEAAGGERFAYAIVIDPSAEPREEPGELKLARVSRGAEFELMQRRALRD